LYILIVAHIFNKYLKKRE